MKSLFPVMSCIGLVCCKSFRAFEQGSQDCTIGLLYYNNNNNNNNNNNYYYYYYYYYYFSSDVGFKLTNISTRFNVHIDVRALSYYAV